MAPTLMDNQHHWVSMIHTDAKGHKKYCWPHHWAAAATTVPNAFSGNYFMDPLQLSFFFRVKTPTNLLIYVGVLWCVLSTFRYLCRCHINQWMLNHLGLHHCNPLQHTHGRHVHILVMVIIPNQECTKLLLPLLFE